jgi:hypothetical protein
MLVCQYIEMEFFFTYIKDKILLVMYQNLFLESSEFNISIVLVTNFSTQIIS